ncbi:hypothetical protein JCM21714_3634 [Gracilibacillus boraciitolerans JCM 21714]|uniref:Uncharacterized protein n=1 Tax=Gracilibacillus boraciitolerans JCM 21714 TaxID=1298598 RepID=W4VP07_9BACI|nr:hypothetical protein [Gracilibacillus boraciitolerans]GAE94474.1 hypothetical protein JCM21714_3634 [Gracilibacillus boraciitolerans JCM 21714]
MSQREKKWRIFYLVLMLFIYLIYIPINIYEWLVQSSGFPITAFVLFFALPLMRYNHLRSIRTSE